MIAMLLAKFFNLFHNESTHILKWYFINPLHAERFFLNKTIVRHGTTFFVIIFSYKTKRISVLVQRFYISFSSYNSKFNSISHKIAGITEHQLRPFIDFERSSTFAFLGVKSFLISVSFS